MTERSFNIYGTCRPDTDYMVDITERVEVVKKMVDLGLYFTINRPRQYGKTTLISALTRRLSNEYICARISFEGLGDESFENAKAFCETLMDKIQTALSDSPAGYDADYIENWMNPEITNFRLLSKHITEMCRSHSVVLLIDEVDKTSNNRVFLHFLGMLRDKYLQRKDDIGYTFKSVVLAGVYDIRNLKLKLETEGVYTPSGHQGDILNSPWNIAAEFNIDMSFHTDEIAAMLADYSSDNSVGMDCVKVAETIYEYTSGYPFLVSRICKTLDEDPALAGDWTQSGAIGAIRQLIRRNDTLIDDLTKNVESNPDLYSFLYNILILGKRMEYTLTVPTIQRAAMFGFIKDGDGNVKISNKIFEMVLTNYFIAKEDLNGSRRRITGYEGDIVRNGRFDMEYCLTKFSEHFRQIFMDKDAPFIEEHGRMLFLTYLKPLINGRGFYHIESRLTDQRRLDLVVDFGLDQFIIELKLWYGETSHEKAYHQLAGYLKSIGAATGYLLTYDFRKEKNRAPKTKWVEWDGLRIFDVMI